ncbi:MAG: fimbrillin family protein [Bacteroidales bacterium]|nr:fimbrillin family protein [Bacteroidales bacterium]
MARLLPYILLLTLVACSGVDPSEQEPDAPLAADPIQLAPSLTLEGRSSSSLTDVATTFSLWATKTASSGAVQAVMDGYSVEWSSASGWQYDGVSGQSLRYWDNTATAYTFTAVAPATTLASVSSDGQITITDITASENWLVARLERTRSPLSDTDILDSSSTLSAPSVLSATVGLPFHHLMAEIEFRVYNEYYEDVEVSYFWAKATTEAIATEATYVAPVNGEYFYLENFDEDSYDSYTDHLFSYDDPVIVTAHDPTTAVSIGEPIRVLPQPFGADNRLYIQVGYFLDGGNVTSDIITLQDGWQPNTHYTYIIAIRALNL